MVNVKRHKHFLKYNHDLDEKNNPLPVSVSDYING